jgi:uncharacterized protein (DUF1501 family)
MSALRLSRRGLLGGAAALGAGLLGARLGFAAESSGPPPVVVVVFLRGAADGLSMVVPHADPAYYRLRRGIAVPRPGEARGAIDLDGRFGLHPRLEPLKAAFDANELAVIHAVGSPHRTRSHFEAQDYMQTGAVGDPTAARGWLGRCLSARVAESAALRAVALSSFSPVALRGYRDALVTENLRDLRLSAGDGLEPVLASGFRELYAVDTSRLAEQAGRRALEASELVRRVLGKRRRSPGYQRDTQDFADVAKLIKADVGLTAAWIDVGGWDTHRRQGSTDNGELPRKLEHLGRALAAFRADLGPAFERVVVLVMSEFGRTARENDTGGTDHGHGNVMLVLGGKVQGGRVLGDFPGLAPEQLHERRDVPVTTDFRDVLAELCELHLQLPDASVLFPRFELDRRRRLGFLRQPI